MPIPPIVDHYSAQIIFKGKSGNPEDVYTNTFYFRNDQIGGSHNEIADQLAADVTEFFNVVPANVVGGVAVSSLLTSAVIQNNAELRVYDVGDPAPRYPRIRTIALTGMGSTVIPSECAICLSYVASENQPRSRGRIYVGPLSESGLAVANGRAQVADAARIGLLGAAKRLIDKPSFTWCLYSPTDQAMKPITGAWVDNAFDTQRRRGEKASTRSSIGTYLGQSGDVLPLV